MMWGYDGFGMAGGGIGMLLFWGLIIVGFVILVRGFGGNSGSSGNEPGRRDATPFDILGVRYARGEIDKAEFEQRRNDLKGR